MPAAVVGGQVKVDQMGGKVAFAPAPINAQIFHQKTRHHHAQTVVHVAGLVDLRHRGIDQRIAGFAIAPGLEQGLRSGAAFPFDAVVIGLEGMRHHAGVVVQNLVVKIAPNQL